MTKLGLELPTIILINTLFLGIWALFVPLMGYIADKIDTKKIMMGSALTLMFAAYPALSLLAVPTVQKVLLFQSILTLIGSAFVGPTTALLTEMFPPGISGVQAFPWATTWAIPFLGVRHP